MRAFGPGLSRPPTSTAAATDPWVFNVQDYGAVANGSTDDTPAIRTALDAAVTYALAQETRYAELWFPVSPTPYLLSSALVQGGATLGNSQIPLPIVEPEDRKLTLVIRGCLDAAAMPHWLQETGQRWGVTLKTTLTGQTNSAAWGAPSVLGGPAITGSSAQFGQSHSANFNNVSVTTEGIGISTPLDPTVGGIDFRALCQAIVRCCAVMPDDDRLAIAVLVPNNDWTFGYLGPDVGNNDRCLISDLSVYGQYVGYKPGEHSWIDRTASIYCHDGVVFSAGLQGVHSIAGGAISIEGCVDAIRVYESERAPVHLSAVSIEAITGADINDPNNALRGEIWLNKISGAINVTGGTNVRVLSQNSALGAVTAPAVPATTVVLRNPFWHDADVLVAGGTVTEITVDGATTGLTSGWVPVRSGGTIAITYSSAPTWKWWAR